MNKKKKHSLLASYKKHWMLMLMFLPVIAYFIIFHYIPMCGVVLAFKDYSVTKGIFGSEWVGLEHFRTMFSGAYFLPALKNTLIISFMKLVFGFPAPIILCLMLNEVRNLKFKKAVQTITYLPHFISWVVLSSIVIEILSPNTGFINEFIKLFGGESIHFIADAKWFRTVLVASSIWKEIGWQSIVYLAAVTSIDPELYDVASIDGAGRLRKIWSITIPCIIPIIIIMFIFQVGSVITDDFDQIYNLLNPSVLSVGEVLGTYTYKVGLQQMGFSYATAVGLFKNVVAIILVTATNAISRKVGDTSLW